MILLEYKSKDIVNRDIQFDFKTIKRNRRGEILIVCSIVKENARRKNIF